MFFLLHLNLFISFDIYIYSFAMLIVSSAFTYLLYIYNARSLTQLHRTKVKNKRNFKWKFTYLRVHIIISFTHSNKCSKALMLSYICFLFYILLLLLVLWLYSSFVIFLFYILKLNKYKMKSEPESERAIEQ